MSAQAAPLNVALVGNPNSGKTALFNRLTGGRQKVANYAGVTVERKSGRLLTPGGRRVQVLDLPGAYSLSAASPDEAITRDVLMGTLAGETRPDMLVCVVDATNLRLHLRFVLEVAALGLPIVVALNMVDLARRRGIEIDTQALSQALGMPVVETVAIRRNGADSLLGQLDTPAASPPQGGTGTGDLHARVREVLRAAVRTPASQARVDDRIDRVVLHPVVGPLLLASLLFLMFQAVFSWAEPAMEAIEFGIGALGEWVAGALPEGLLHSLLVDGIFAGIGGVLVFLPQILILFFFILVLEESGYLPRAAFLLDRLMFKAGLTGRAFIPLLSSFACAIPGIMAARTISDPRDRLTTILVAPLMTCSARLPVYALLIAAFIPQQTVWGVFNLQGIVLFGLYVFGIVSALVVALVMKWLRRDRSEHALLMELPSYRVPHLWDLLLGLYERALIFLKRVGGIILVVTIVLWFLATFPAPPEGATGAAIDYSFAGRLGHLIQPVFAPLGFNWQICIALIPGLAAREVAVAALGTVYSMSGEEETVAAQLGQLISDQWTLATALALLVWYVFAPQCLSTLATIRRETNSWKQVGIAAGYLFGLAYLAALLTYQIAAALG
ncbi:ferrous iron transport protein B [Coralloluteibacterium thermophilus]|uniref:Ferrous iron transport protein B n=1 Tax=Coralloluteibacterium thermophilum TaxID=2707049 RepID=A0ABV9NIR7_9GAMM